MNDLEPVPHAIAGREFVPGRIAFAGSATVLAAEARERLVALYGDCPLEQATVVVSLGGDGFMLETIHRVLPLRIPVYGMNCGSVGFLMNTFSEEDVPGRLSGAQEAELHPLRMLAVTESGAVEEALALNEVSLLRQLRQRILDDRRPLVELHRVDLAARSGRS